MIIFEIIEALTENDVENRINGEKEMIEKNGRKRKGKQPAHNLLESIKTFWCKSLIDSRCYC